jgi:hypothetical protein
MTPRCIKIKLDQVDGFRLATSVNEYLKNGGKPSRLKGAMLEKYKELYLPPRIKKTVPAMGAEDAAAIEQMHKDLRDGKTTVEKLMSKGAH